MQRANETVQDNGKREAEAIWDPISSRNVFWAEVVAQLVEWWLPTPEVRSPNPVVGIFLYKTLYRIFLNLK